MQRTTIVDAASKLFSHRGYGDTTLEDIAECVGVRKGAIYYHVPRKSDLLVEIVRNLLEPICVELRRIRDLPESAEVKLRLAIRRHVEELVTNGVAARVFFEERHDLPADAASDLLAIDHDIRQIFQEIVEEGVESGVFRDMDPQITTMHILALCNWPYRWFREGGGLSSVEFIDQTIGFVFNGIASSSCDQGTGRAGKY